MNWLRRSGLMDDSYIKRAKKQPIFLPPRIEQLIPPEPASPTLHSSTVDDIQSLRSPVGTTGALGSPGLGSGLDRSLSPPLSPGLRPLHDEDAVAVITTLHNASFAVLATPISRALTAFPSTDPRGTGGAGAAAAAPHTASPATYDDDHLHHEYPPHRRGSPVPTCHHVVHVPPQQRRWERPTCGGIINLYNRTTEERDRLRLEQRRSYKAQLKLRDPPVAVRFPNVDWAESDEEGRVAGATTEEGGQKAGKEKSSSPAPGRAGRRGGEQSNRSGSSTPPPRSSSTGRSGRPPPANTEPRRYSGARATDTSDCEQEHVPRALMRLCTTGLTMLDYVEGTIAVRVMQYQKQLSDPVVGTCVDPYSTAVGETGDCGAVYYQPKPFTYFELVENPKLLSAERRREIRAAVHGSRSLSSDRYGGPVPYEKQPTSHASRRVSNGAAAASGLARTSASTHSTPLRAEDVSLHSQVRPTGPPPRPASFLKSSGSGVSESDRRNSATKTALRLDSTAPTAPPSRVASAAGTPKRMQPQPQQMNKGSAPARNGSSTKVIVGFLSDDDSDT